MSKIYLFIHTYAKKHICPNKGQMCFLISIYNFTYSRNTLLYFSVDHKRKSIYRCLVQIQLGKLYCPGKSVHR